MPPFLSPRGDPTHAGGSCGGERGGGHTKTPPHVGEIGGGGGTQGGSWRDPDPGGLLAPVWGVPEGLGGGPNPQSLSEPTALEPFLFLLAGLGLVSSSSEALLDPDSSSLLGG